MMAPRTHPDRPLPADVFYQQYVRDTVHAEQIGMDYAFYGEHHLRPCQWTGSPLMMAAYAAAKTTKIRLGTSVICLPFHHPLRLAEDVAALDTLCGGRFEFGVGPGSQWEEFHAWNIDPTEMHGRSWEAMDIIQKCFSSSEPFTHKGKYWQFNDVTFTGQPLQKPLPIWWGGFGPKNIKKAAEHGFHLYSSQEQTFDEALRAAGRDPMQYMRSNGGGGYVVIAPTKEKALEEAVEGYWYFRNFYNLRRRLDGSMPPSSAELTRDQIRRDNDENKPGLIADTLESAKARILANFKAVGPAPNRMAAFLFRLNSQSDASVIRTMDLFGEHILPALKKL
jgi:alkanesulfonate monooxygenase SsuD/methylene tetrahydromethanopterin reductase-like flavin-dependent oxidoreductase (luciferase family)